MSVPIVVLGSTVVLKLVERFPLIIQAGAAVLAFTAARMIVNEPSLDPVFDPPHAVNTLATYATYVVAVAGVLWAGRQRAPTAGG